MIEMTYHVCMGEGNGNPLQYSCLENPSGLLSLESHRVGHDCNDLAVVAAAAAAAILYILLDTNYMFCEHFFPGLGFVSSFS